MKFNNLSLVGMLGGFIFTILAGLRYFALYPDLDRALAYCVLGFLVIGISFVYGRLRMAEDTLLAVENYLADRPWDLEM
ncbi:MAG: hypothetical protein NUV97_04245 [archaeon]|nr:hypothetical protein [archaeon]MCR4323539.1 hypothetical protein [Nanoarchaeota archaeon]